MTDVRHDTYKRTDESVVRHVQPPILQRRAASATAGIGQLAHKTRLDVVQTQAYAHEMQTVLLHEMIHYYIAWKGIRDDAPHGSVFRSIMNRLNTRHGWDISVSASMRGRKTAAPHNDRRPRLVLALENSRGECFLTVVNPRYAAQLKSRLKNAADATQRAWFVSTDPFFSDFTTVRSLRARKIKREVFDEKIACGTMVDI